MASVFSSATFLFLLFLALLAATIMSSAEAATKVWPHLVGKDGEAAKAAVQQDNPSITSVHVLKAGSMVTQDFRHDRVRIYVDATNKVLQPPAVG